MLLLHAAFLDGRLLLWAETAPPEDLARPAGRRPRKPRPRPHPFAATAAELHQALAAVASDQEPATGQELPHLAWLPTAGGLPVPSSPILSGLPAPRRGPEPTPELAPWTVATLALTPAQGLDLLAAAAHRHHLAPGLLVGPDLRFWAEAVRLAGSLLVRQRFLPAVAKQGGRWHARWEPVLLGPDAQRLAQLAAAMPGACRALTPPAATAPPEMAPGQLLIEFVTHLVDHVVRTAGVAEPPAGAHTFASLHEQWLHALTSPDGRLTGTNKELAALAAQVQEWRRPLAVLHAAPFRLCFRLEEPAEEGRPEEGDPWTVRYLLQAAHDPSLLLPLADAWAAAEPLPAFQTGQSRAQLQEFMLVALGQAARLSPHIERSLHEAVPAGYSLDTAGAYQFLTETAPALQQAGFVVMLPSWWTGTGTGLRLGARARVRSPRLQASSGLSLDQVVQVDWEVALGEETLSLAELRSLARLKTPLIKLRGRWVQVDAAALQRAAALLRERDAGLTVRDLMRMALGDEGEASAAAPLPVTDVEATGWVNELLASLRAAAGEAAGSPEEVPPPPGFTGTLRPYQVRGYSWLAQMRRWGLGACLADDMGLGKTVQTLALIQREWAAAGAEQPADTQRPVAAAPPAEGEEPAASRRPVLLVCPTSVVQNWHHEAARFTPDLPVMVHHGLARLRGPAFIAAARESALVITTYALLHRDLEFLQEVPWLGVVLDEAQNIKNPETKQARAARQLPADFRVALTGTPVENNVGDLWSLMQFLNPGLLGSHAEFKRRYFLPIQMQQDDQAAARLRRITAPFILRRLKTDRRIIDDLPEKIESKVFCTLTREQATLYQAVVQEAEEPLETATEMERRGIVLATLAKLKQICNHPAHFLKDHSALAGRSGKLSRLTEMCDELLAVGDRALIFTQFAEMGELLRRHLQETFGREVLFLHGGLPKGQRDRMVERFQSDDGPPLFVLSLKAGGTGLNLTRANHVFHFDRWWNPAVENQATDRAFRIGQTRNVQVHKFVCSGTLEEKIDALIARKQTMAERIVGAGENWLTEVSTAELMQIIKLEPGASAEED